MVGDMGRDEMRAADADRQRVADQLRTALEEGRLDLHEYDERLQQAFAAKTYGELDVLLADLPTASAPKPPGVAPVRNPAGEWLGQVWGSWVFVVVVTSAVWAITSLASGGVDYFWPVWVAGPWGLCLIVASIGGLASGAPRKMVEDRERRALAKERKRERKALRAETAAHGELRGELLGELRGELRPAKAEPPASPPVQPATQVENDDMSASRVIDTPDHG
jgi:hypothetical protein